MTLISPPTLMRPIPASPPLTQERVRAAEAFALAYARKRGGRVRVRPDVWLELRAAGADMSLYICDTR
ncbi:hypothetical protein [Ancylobacter rudongensis]|uniref:Uncharacterized protein n=1 Tax=Ancylobacter rudongensis TaxID=177413 RepID=A0A1G4TEC3_9HYPH|nr:hypothetical protein [Ancylobacter rudongensis]SCW78949.1 hypothetical protein SAMN05660859_2823 [Ancylobacter rudongensis]